MTLTIDDYESPEHAECNNCKRSYSWDTPGWIGYAYYCPDCFRAYWDGADEALKALRCKWIDRYIDRATYEAESSHGT